MKKNVHCIDTSSRQVSGILRNLNWDKKETVFFFIVFLFILEAACKKDKSVSPPAISTLSFSYSGVKTGTYMATGEIPASSVTIIWNHEWAGAESFTDWGEKWIGIHANLLSSPGSHVFNMYIPDRGKGTFSLPVSFNPGILIFNYEGGQLNDEQYSFKSGSVSLTSYSKACIAGTFSGVVKNFNADKLITITNGHFDLRLTPG